MKPAPVADLLSPAKARVPAKPVTAADVRLALDLCTECVDGGGHDHA